MEPIYGAGRSASLTRSTIKSGTAGAGGFALDLSFAGESAYGQSHSI